MTPITEKAYQQAIATIKKCSTHHGLYASGGRKGYKGVWSRDSVITFLGASLIKNPKFKETFKKSLVTLGDHQSKNGQIPNAVLKFNADRFQVDYLSIDSSLWFIIGHYLYKEKYKDKSLFHKYHKNIEQAFTWLRYQDFGERGVLEQLPTTDWQDAFPNKYGHTINTQVLYYKSLKLSGQYLKAWKLKRKINKSEELKLWNGNFYWAYRWKNHNKYKETGKWFDSFANLLAIVFDFTSKSQSEKIISYIQKHEIHRPYPVKAIYPPITKKSEYWEDYYLDARASPNNYLNGGIWPFIGGLYVLALIKLKKFGEAEKELEILAEANMRNHTFPEWIHPIDKKTYGELQAWSAGTYILAYESFKNRRCLII